jgi:hypothetical protein
MVPAAVREGLEKRRLAWKKEYLTIEQKKCGFSLKAFLDNFF